MKVGVGRQTQGLIHGEEAFLSVILVPGPAGLMVELQGVFYSPALLGAEGPKGGRPSPKEDPSGQRAPREL